MASLENHVPLDPAYPEARLAFILEDADAPVLVTQARLRDRLPRRARVVCVDEDAAELERVTLQRIFERNGGIVLFHDIKPVTADALPNILAGLAARDFAIVHLTSKFSFTPMDRFKKELRQRLDNAEEPVAKVSLAGLQGTLRPSSAPPPAPPPVTLLSPERRKVELATARAQRMRTLIRSIDGRAWSRIVEEKAEVA